MLLISNNNINQIKAKIELSIQVLLETFNNSHANRLYKTVELSPSDNTAVHKNIFPSKDSRFLFVSTEEKVAVVISCSQFDHFSLETSASYQEAFKNCAVILLNKFLYLPRNIRNKYFFIIIIPCVWNFCLNVLRRLLMFVLKAPIFNHHYQNRRRRHIIIIVVVIVNIIVLVRSHYSDYLCLFAKSQVQSLPKARYMSHRWFIYPFIHSFIYQHNSTAIFHRPSVDGISLKKKCKEMLKHSVTGL